MSVRSILKKTKTSFLVEFKVDNGVCVISQDAISKRDGETVVINYRGKELEALILEEGMNPVHKLENA